MCKPYFCTPISEKVVYVDAANHTARTWFANIVGFGTDTYVRSGNHRMVRG